MNTKNAFPERLRQAIEFLKKSGSIKKSGKVSNKTISDKWGIKERSFYQYISGDVSCDLASITKFGEAFPEISLNWLILGNGDMEASMQDNAVLDITEIDQDDYKSKFELIKLQVLAVFEASTMDAAISRLNLLRETIKSQ